LFTIRFVESGERYDAPPNRGNASGAYQYIASTWNNYRGFPHAYLAPPEVQDERALADVQAILARWKGDVSMVPVIWYYPKAATDPALMDQVPVPSAGNRLTVREYQHRWLNVYAYVTGNVIRYGLEAVPPDLKYISGIPPELTADQPTPTEIAYPVLGRSVVVPPVACDDCGGGTEAIVYGTKLQPILAVVDGVVTARQLDDPVSGAVTLAITDRRGNTFHYSGFNDDHPDTSDGAAPPWLRFTSLAEVGTPVWAGQIVGFMGDTDPMPSQEHVGVGDEPVWPHIRLRAVGADGTPLDADALVFAAQSRQACHVGIGPWSVPPIDPTIDPTIDGLALRDRDDVFVSAILDGGWTLHADGTVTAVGRAALIVPPVDCMWAPQEPFGPGASGNRPPDDWGAPFAIDARHWVSGVLAADGDALAIPVRR
jgi:hypothetical protein